MSEVLDAPTRFVRDGDFDLAALAFGDGVHLGRTSDHYEELTVWDSRFASLASVGAMCVRGDQRWWWHGPQRAGVWLPGPHRSVDGLLAAQVRWCVGSAEIGPTRSVSWARHCTEVLDAEGQTLMVVAEDRFGDDRSVLLLPGDPSDGATPTNADAVSKVIIEQVPLGDPMRGLPEVFGGPVPYVLWPLSLVRAGVTDLSSAMIDALAVNADEDVIHDARVAVRRLRWVIEALEPVLDGTWVTIVDRRLEELQELLGTTRDDDVVAARLTAHAQRLGGHDGEELAGLARRLVARRHAQVKHAHEVLRSPEWAELVDDLHRAASMIRKDPLLPTALVESLAERAIRLVAKADRDKIRQIHRARLAVEMARAVALMAPSDAGSLAGPLGELQEALGVMTDADLVEQWAGAKVAARVTRRQAFALGRVVERERRRSRDASETVDAARRKVQRQLKKLGKS